MSKKEDSDFNPFGAVVIIVVLYMFVKALGDAGV